MFANSTLVQNLVDIVACEFPYHPFASLAGKQCLPHLLGEYAAMSQMFPYIQAKALGEVAIRAIRQGQAIDESVEITAAVGAFLVSDETGVNYVLHSMGHSHLPHILHTKEFFHSRLLESDIQELMGRNIAPSYSSGTLAYLENLYLDLSDADHVNRCAAMIAFEQHAERMILSLWGSIAKLCDSNKNSLLYFKTHVGGDDPAEAYHVAMTQSMMDMLVPEDKELAFLAQFKRCYASHIIWCEMVAQINM